MIKNFEEFETVDEALQSRNRTSYECYMVSLEAYKDDYNDGESIKSVFTNTISNIIADYTLDGLLKKLEREYDYYVSYPINKDSSYYDTPIIHYNSGLVKKDWKPLSKQEKVLWKNGEFTDAYQLYVDFFIRKVEDVPAEEVLKFVNRP